MNKIRKRFFRIPIPQEFNVRHQIRTRRTYESNDNKWTNEIKAELTGFKQALWSELNPNWTSPKVQISRGGLELIQF